MSYQLEKGERQTIIIFDLYDILRGYFHFETTDKLAWEYLVKIVGRKNLIDPVVSPRTDHVSVDQRPTFKKFLRRIHARSIDWDSWHLSTVRPRPA